MQEKILEKLLNEWEVESYKKINEEDDMEIYMIPCNYEKDNEEKASLKVYFSIDHNFCALRLFTMDYYVNPDLSDDELRDIIIELNNGLLYGTFMINTTIDSKKTRVMYRISHSLQGDEELNSELISKDQFIDYLTDFVIGAEKYYQKVTKDEKAK